MTSSYPELGMSSGKTWNTQLILIYFLDASWRVLLDILPTLQVSQFQGRFKTGLSITVNTVYGLLDYFQTKLNLHSVMSGLLQCHPLLHSLGFCGPSCFAPAMTMVQTLLLPSAPEGAPDSDRSSTSKSPHGGTEGGTWWRSALCRG